MKLISKSPHYLVRNSYSYCFRLHVPKDLQKSVGRKELRYSLKTGYLGVARFKAQMIASQVQQIFACLRQGGRTLSDLPDEKIQELVQQYLKDYIESLESRYYDDPPFPDERDFYSHIKTLDYIREDIIEYLGVGDYQTVEEIVADLLRKNEIEGIERGSTVHVKLCREVLRAQLRGIELEKQHMSEGFSESPEASFKEQLPSTLQRANGGEEGPLISEVIDRTQLRQR